MDALLHGFADRLFVPGRDFFSGIGQGAVQIEGDDLILFFIISLPNIYPQFPVHSHSQRDLQALQPENYQQLFLQHVG